jgi:hypothetical protein
MKTGRKLALAVAIMAEILTLVAIVLAFRPVVSNGWRWSEANWTIEFGPQVQEERVIALDEVKGTLRLINNRGKIQIKHDGTPAVARAKVYGYGADKAAAQESLSSVEVTTTIDGADMTIAVKAPNGIGRMPYADLVVVVPDGINVIVEAAMGDVDVDDFTGVINVVANMGRVDLDNIRGSIDVRANMGSIDLRKIVIEDSLRAHADMGSISFRGSLGKQNSFEANMGGISLRLDDDHPALQLDAAWKMGSFENHLSFNGTVSERQAVGVLGDSNVTGGNLHIRADMGSISIR